MEGHRGAWIAFGSVLLAVALGTPVTVWAVTSANSKVKVPVWLLLFAAVIGVIGVYVLASVAKDWWLPWKPAVGSTPPGGAVPFVAPTDYQVRQLRQVVRKIAVTNDEFDHLMLGSVLANHPRTGTDPVYEPLHAMTVREGMQALVDRGELELIRPYLWKITSKGQRRRFFWR